MSFHQVGELRYYAFELFRASPVRQAIFTRLGGTSPSPWNSLNVGGTNGDERERVIENRRLMFAAFGRPVESLFDVWQVHGSEVVCTEKPRPLDEPHKQADIILTNQPEITLFMRFGDCVPIFLFDPVKKAIGLAHAGWQGTVHKVARAAVQSMQDTYHSNPGDILTGIGPSVGAHHYEVGTNVVEAVKQAFGAQSEKLLVQNTNGRMDFDLWEANRLTLQEAGVHQVEISGVCTVCHRQEWFSHRGDEGKTGRFGALFALENAAEGG